MLTLLDPSALEARSPDRHFIWPRSRRVAKDAMTLVEVLVSTCLLVVVVMLLTAVFNETTRAWMATQSRSDKDDAHRMLTDRMAAELRGALLPVEKKASTTSPNLQFLINPTDALVPPEYKNPHSIFWQAPLATEASMGEIAELGYFVKWEIRGGGAVPSLRRFFVNPTVYQPVSRKYAANVNFQIYRNSTRWLTPALLAKVAPADEASSYAGLLAENVVGLWVRFYGENGQEIRTAAGSSDLAASFDSRVGYEYQVAGGSGSAPPARAYLPRRVELSLAQVDARHAPLLRRSWQKVRAMANAPGTRDAATFEKVMMEFANDDGEIRRLLPGVRVGRTMVTLKNAR